MTKNNTENEKWRDSQGRFVKGNKIGVGLNRNPTGKGGFRDNPQNRSNGFWKSEDSIGFQYKKLVRMTVDEFENWIKDNPKEERTIAQELAYKAVIQARKDLAYLKEVTDRTEGKASQNIDMTSGGKPIPLLDYIEKKKK